MPGLAGVRLALALAVSTICGSFALADIYPHCPDPARRDYDVIVVGAGTSGIMAAIQAARLGASVAVIEETNMIGGQIAAGVAGMDGGQVPPVRSGLYSKYRDRVHQFYDQRGYSANICFWGGGDTCSSPSVSAGVFWGMLNDLVPAGAVLCPFLGKKVVGVEKDQNRVTGVTTSSPTEEWTSQVLIDATEYGDLIDNAGAAYRIGRAQVPGDPVADNCIQDITYVAVVRDYLSIDASPDIPEPPHYSEPDTTLVKRSTQMQAEVNQSPAGAPEFLDDCPLDWDAPRDPPWPGNQGDHNGYRAIPDLAIPPTGIVTRTAVNYINDYPGFWTESCHLSTPVPHWRGKLSADFIENVAARANLACEAKLLTLQLLHHMQTQENPATPEPEIQLPTWGIADDEYSGNPSVCGFPGMDLSESRLPAIPYVRESRRIVGMNTLTGKDIKRLGPSPLVLAANNEMALAVGDYTTDVHNCNDLGDFESYPEILETFEDRSTTFGPFQIPFGAFIPQSVDGFLPAEKNLAYTRLASAAARVQPTTMSVGQAAGALAALAALKTLQPREVRVLDVQKTLLGEDAALARETFDDVPIGDPAWRDVQIVATHEVLRDFEATAPGRYLFNPNQEPQVAEVNAVLGRLFPSNPPVVVENPWVRRAALAQALAIRLWGSLPPEPVTPPVFLDVPKNWGCNPGPCLRGAIERLYSEGYVLPCTASSSHKWFCPTGYERRGWLAHAAAQVMYTTWP
jgi:hypothetical protein